MDLQLNAADDDGSSAGENSPSPAPPAFTLPVSRISANAGVSLVSILSSNSPQTPQTNTPPPRFELPVARYGGISSLMNSPMVDEKEPQHSSYMEAMEAAEKTLVEHQQRQDVEMKGEEEEDVEDGEEMDQEEDGEDQDEEEEGEAKEGETGNGNHKRRRGYSIASELSSAVSTPPRSTTEEKQQEKQQQPSVSSPASVAIPTNLLSLEDAELDEIQKALHHAVEKYLYAESHAKAIADGAALPASKRHRKGKHQHKKKAAQAAAAAAAALSPTAVVAESLVDVEKCISKLQDKITVDLLEMHVLRDVVRVCLAFLGIVNGVDPVVADADASNSDTMAAALTSLQQKPVHLQLASTIRRVVLSVSESETRVILGDLMDWVLTNSNSNNTPSDADGNATAAATTVWSWLFVFISQLDAYAVVDFLIHHAISEQDKPSSQQQQQQQQLILTVLDHLAMRHSAEIVDVLSKTLTELASSTDDGPVPVDMALFQLVALGSNSPPTLLRALDDSFQWVFTKEIVLALDNKLKHTNPNTNGTHEEPRSLGSAVLKLVGQKSEELPNSSFQLVLLLQHLSSASSSSSSSSCFSQVHEQLVGVAQRQTKMTLLRGLYDKLPYIAHTVVELLADAQQPQQPNEPPSESTAALASWRQWLVAIAASPLSRRHVTQQLVQADLTRACAITCQTTDASFPVKAEIFVDLLCDLVLVQDPSSTATASASSSSVSSELVALVCELFHWLQQMTAVSEQTSQRRLLAILDKLLERTTTTPTAANVAIVEAPQSSTPEDREMDQLLAAFRQMSPWQESWTQLALWRGASGAELWGFLMDLVLVDNDELVASQALQLLLKTPFPSLEDPKWQFQCLRKLTSVYFYTLRQYRESLLLLDDDEDQEDKKTKKNKWLAHLEKLRVVIGRVLAVDGAVAQYASSVCTQFTSLWMDAMLNTASATSVPTHFPRARKPIAPRQHHHRPAATSTSTTLASHHDEIVIRSERTISSKCTNLQSSQVITAHAQTKLVYRNALDETWEKEMHAAHSCSQLASRVLAQLVNGSVPLGLGLDLATSEDTEESLDDSDQIERRVKCLVDMLLDRAIPCCGMPSDDVYKDFLPNRSSFDMDLRVEQWLNHFPAFLPLVKLIVETTCALPTTSQSLRLLPVVKAALVVLLGHWNSVKGDALDVNNMDVPPYMRNQNQLALSCELVSILRITEWLPEPLARTAELLPLTTPADIRAILLSCWFYLADHPPTNGTPAQSQLQVQTAAATAAGKMPMDFYLLPVRKALHRNIHKVGAKFPVFMC